MLNNKTFYPTPSHLVRKMWHKVETGPRTILEPSAGKGDLIENIFSERRRADVFAIEIDPDLQATLRGKGIKVLDSDFLSFAGPDKFDLIIANPPFDEGEKHLLKAIDIMYRGEIVFLLNAETLRNPYSHTRKTLARQLDALGADVEYIKDAFWQAERKTRVEVALIHIQIKRQVEDDLFSDCEDKTALVNESICEQNEVSTGKTIFEMVAEYNQCVQMGTDTIVSYYRNHKRIGKYLRLNDKPDAYDASDESLTAKMQKSLNALLKALRKDYWCKTLELKEVTQRLTKAKREAFYHDLSDRSQMDFTEKNIRQFVLNVIKTYEQTLIAAVLDLFDMFSIRHAYRNIPEETNIHYFNGWKTNKAFKVKKRVIVPLYGSLGSPFLGWSGWKLDYQAAETLRDFDLVMSYFDGLSDYASLAKAIEYGFKDHETKGESTYFKFKCHKKGTIHLEFKNMDILRRFNVVACRGKGWLPQDYGAKTYEALTYEEKAVVDGFEGAKSYNKNRDRALFADSTMEALPEPKPLTLI